MAFVNRKQFCSINVQAVCDSDAFITNIVARWPGSTHDSRNFEYSKIADKLRDGALEGILVGDSGCACRAYLITPIVKPKNDTIHICFFCACIQKKITDVHAYPDETDSRLFNKLLRHLNVTTVIHKWCVN